MEKLKIVMVAIDVAIVVALIILGVGLLFGLGGFTVELAVVFLAFAVAAMFVDAKGTIAVFLKGADEAFDIAHKEIDEAVAAGSVEAKKALKDLIDHAQDALSKLEAKL